MPQFESLQVFSEETFVSASSAALDAHVQEHTIERKRLSECVSGSTAGWHRLQ